MDFVRLRILGLLQQNSQVLTTSGNDFADVAKWLPGSRLLITYVAGPYPNDEQNHFIRNWLEAGGRWLALHGTSGGKAAPVDGKRYVRKMVKGGYHDTLGCFFLNHPPVRKFRVDVADRGHALTQGLPASFEVMDELYLIELQDPANSHLLLTTVLEKDPSPPGFGFAYDQRYFADARRQNPRARVHARGRDGWSDLHRARPLSLAHKQRSAVCRFERRAFRNYSDGFPRLVGDRRNTRR